MLVGLKNKIYCVVIIFGTLSFPMLCKKSSCKNGCNLWRFLWSEMSKQSDELWVSVGDIVWRRSKASPSVGGSALPSLGDDDLLDELIGDIGNISNVTTGDAVTSDDQLLLEMQELLSWYLTVITYNIAKWSCSQASFASLALLSAYRVL